MTPDRPEPPEPPEPPRPRPLGEEELARAALTYLAEPGDPALGALLEICTPGEILAAIRADLLPGIGPGCGDRPATRKALDRALESWRARLSRLPDDSGLTDAGRHGVRLVCPTDPEWPAGLDELGQARPYALWCEAVPTWGRPARVRWRWWDAGPPPDTARTSRARSPATSVSEAGRSSRAGRTASTPPRTAGRWRSAPPRSPSWPAAWITRTRRVTRTCSRASPSAAW